MSLKARIRLAYLVAGLALLVVIAVAGFLLSRVFLAASEEVPEVTRIDTVIVVTTTPTSGPTPTIEFRFIGVDFAGPEDITALYERGGEIQATGLAGDVVYIEGLLYQVYHTEPNSGEFFFPEGEVVTLTLKPVFPTLSLPDEFPNSLRIELQ